MLIYAALEVEAYAHVLLEDCVPIRMVCGLCCFAIALVCEVSRLQLPQI